MPGNFWHQYVDLSNICEMGDAAEDIERLKQTRLGLFVITWPFDTYSIAEVFANGATIFKTLLILDLLLVNSPT